MRSFDLLRRNWFRREKIQRSSSGTSPLAAGSRHELCRVFRDPGLAPAAFQTHEDEARGVPDLVGEVAGAVDALVADDDVGARGRGDHEQRHADGVGAVLLGHSSGSMTLPLVFDIFCLSASRTRPWM